MFSATPMYVDSPRHLQCVATCPVGCSGVSVNGVVCAVRSRLFEDIDIKCVVGAVVTMCLCFYKFAKAGVEVCEVAFVVAAGVGGVVYA